jgi:1-pyrroline-4-hydroxy-2-carboxylate deaminase
MIRWTGVFPAVTTKFTADHRLDSRACETHFKWLVEAGVDGLIVAGSLGESSSLTRDERFELARIAQSVCAPNIPVLITIAEGATEEAVRLVVRAEAEKLDGIMLLPPIGYHASQLETLEWFRTVSGATQIPVMIYNNPVSYQNDVAPQMVAELCEQPNIVAIKESSDDVRRVLAIRSILGDRISIFTGVDNLALESCLVGADGWVAGLVDAFPSETVAVWRLARAGRIDEALEIYRWFSPLLELDVSPRLVQNIKLAESIVGVGTEFVRPPRKPLAGADRERIEGIIRKALFARPKLPKLPTRY